MREIHVRVSSASRSTVESLLDDRGIDYTTLVEGEEVHVYFPLPTAAVSTVLDDFEEAHIDSGSYTVLRKVEFVQTPNFEALRERYRASVRSLSMRELHGKIREIQWPYQLYYVGTLLSVVAATSGLLLGQPALLIGAMIIAPQASSALAAPAGVLTSDWGLFTTSIREQVLSLGLAIGGAALFAAGLRWSGFVPSDLAVTSIDLVGLRLAPTLLSTIGAIIAGIVGAFGYTTEQSTALIGVMVAAALIPAAAAVGLAIAWTAPVFGIGAFLLLMVNLLAINVGAFVTLVGMGYRPSWTTGDRSLSTSIPRDTRLLAYGMLLLVIVATLGTGYYTGTNIVFTRQVNQEVEETLNQPAYEALSVVGVQVGFGGRPVASTPTPVTIELIRAADRPYPGLATRFERHIERRTDRDVRVVVQFTETRVGNGSGPLPSVSDDRPGVSVGRDATTPS